MLETKNAGGSAPEIEKIIGDMSTAFDAFKKKNDERLTEIEKKGSADATTDAAIKKIEESMQKSQDEMKAAHAALEKRNQVLELAIGRKGLNGGSDTDAAETKAAADMTRMCGREINVEGFRSYKSAFVNYLRSNNIRAEVEEVKALVSGSDPDGGYLVPPDMSGRIITLVNETSPFRQIADVVASGSDTFEGMNDLGQAGTGWTGETTAPAETATPDLGKYSIPVHEQYAEPRITQKMLDDAMFDVEGWVTAKIADRLSRTETASFFTGNGAQKPRGFLTYAAGTPSASSWNKIEQIASGASGAFAGSNPADALISLVYALKAAYRDGAVFTMARGTLAAVRKLKDGNGQYIWQPDFTKRDGGALLGHSVVEAEDMPALAANSLSIALGDFKQAYQIVDRQSIRVLRDSFTSKPYVKFYTTKRVGGAVVNFEAVKLMKFAVS